MTGCSYFFIVLGILRFLKVPWFWAILLSFAIMFLTARLIIYLNSRYQRIVEKLSPGEKITVNVLSYSEFSNVYPHDFTFLDFVRSVRHADGRTEIFIADELIKFLNNDELRFVLAHEVAHHLRKHVKINYRLLQSREKMLKKLREMVPRPSLIDRLLGKTSKLPPDWLTEYRLTSKKVLYRMVYEEEKEADVIAVALLKRAGYSIEGAYSYLIRIARLKGRIDDEKFEYELDKQLVEFMRNEDLDNPGPMWHFTYHPSPSIRLRNLIEHYPEMLEFEKKYGRIP